MNRFLAALCGVLAILLVAACTTAPGSSPARSTAPATINPIASTAVDTAQEALCDAQSPTGLAMLTDAVEDVDDTTDFDALNTSLNTALANLARVETDATTEVLAATVAAAGQAFQQGLSDPTTRAQTAGALGDALRELEGALCG